MMNFKLLKIILAAAVFVLLFVFSDFSNSVDKSTENIFSSIRGQLNPDSNIVLITISDDDIAQIGPWPIKRSYYALLIKSLTEYNVKKIGIEIFLSSRFSSQAVYDNLLTREIQKSGRVVLSSLSGEINFKDGKYFSDSLSYPSPKLIDDKIPTGHLNYLSDNGIFIPLTIRNQNINEKAFSYQLFGKKISSEKIKVNFISGWKKFKQYSFLEFFQKYRAKDNSLKNLKDKIIIIGVTDPQISSVNINTTFDDNLPGAALHAFALDNLLNNRSLNYNFVLLSKIIFILLIFGLIFFQIKKGNKKLFTFYFAVFVLFFLISFFLFTFLNIELAYSFFIFPLAAILLIDLINLFSEKEAQLEGSLDEAQILKNLLSKKEEELSELQKNLNLTKQTESISFQNKIQSLKTEIEKLKEKEEDKVEADQINISEVKNFHGIVYRSKIMANKVELIKKTAPEDANILILGESGTGKELAARAVHSLSGRKENNFVAVNCGALSDSLLESELFGHVKGAFTGAVSDKVGRFEAANKGTIFLDEIAETSMNFQVKLLRVIQTGDFEKVGSSETSHTDVRIIAATNKNIEEMVKEKKFREDLYYRLNVIKIELPPLRERREDIDVLAQYFLSNESKEMKLSQALLTALNEYEWKGNIRELEAVIKRGVIFAKSAGRNLLQLTDLPDEITKNIKLNFDDLVIESLRNKNFSHSSINETAKELGNVSRTIISENFRGIVFKIYVENNFDIENTVRKISNSENEEINERVRTKVQTFVNNVERDLNKLDEKKFNDVKEKLSSKYKNLPQKFHFYLDEIVRRNCR